MRRCNFLATSKPTTKVILSEVPRFSLSRGLCAARDAVEGSLFDFPDYSR